MLQKSVILNSVLGCCFGFRTVFGYILGLKFQCRSFSASISLLRAHISNFSSFFRSFSTATLADFCISIQPSLPQPHKAEKEETFETESIPKLIKKDEPESEEPKSKKLLDPKLDYVLINRPSKIQEARQELPILSDEGTVLEAVAENDFVVLCGETGSGKTTQVPQFLYEAGFCARGMIGMTEPRRIAATSAAERIRYEMCKTEAEVAHHIRYENKTTKETQICVMTDGVLLR